jgi:murein tripeptide amidase MpaA
MDMLSVTSRVQDPEVLKKRKGIVVSARVHPGETNSSWVMLGFLDYILSEDPTAVFLRNHFVIRIIPMLNPDGVIVGNHRCNLNGFDLNRQWKSKNPVAIPEVRHLKEMVTRFAEERPIALYCDFHGHK